MIRKLCVLLACVSFNVVAKPCATLPYTPGFIAGQYELLARDPDSLKTYAGLATVTSTKKGDAVLLVETVKNSPSRTWQGHFRPASPGEGCVLELESSPYKASCLVTVDLDNMARLTCRWGWKDKETKVPGMVALFPVAGA